jgi:hypothetical protein
MMETNMHTLLHVLLVCAEAIGILAIVAGALVVIGCIVLANDEASGDNPFQ